MAKTLKVALIKNCMECPHVDKMYDGAGTDTFVCGKTRRYDNVIASHVEYPSEAPQNHKFPKWCPLKDK
jgi:hypothetical protein